MAARLQEHGIRLYYHNHHIDFAKYDGRYLLDVLAERAPLVGFEIDVHWVQRGGLDPVATLRKYGGRVAMVHLKDYRIGRISPAAFEALDAGDRGPWEAELAQGRAVRRGGRGQPRLPGRSSTRASRSAPSTCSSSRTSTTGALRSSACRPRTTTSWGSATASCSSDDLPVRFRVMKEETMAGTLRLGIIGLGTQGSIYAQQITDGLVEGLVVGAIADVDPAKADVAASKYPDVPFFDDYAEAARLRDGRRGGDHRAALPAPADRHRGAASRPARAHREAGGCLHEAGRRAERVRGHQAVRGVRHHAQPAQQPAVPAAQGDRRERRDRRHPALQLDHHHVVAHPAVLRLRARGGPPGAARAGACW